MAPVARRSLKGTEEGDAIALSKASTMMVTRSRTRNSYTSNTPVVIASSSSDGGGGVDNPDVGFPDFTAASTDKALKETNVIPAPSHPSSSRKNEDDSVSKAKPKQQRRKRKPNKSSKKFKVAYTNKKAAKELSRSGINELLSAKEDLSYFTEEEKLLLSSWGLPLSILGHYKAKGVTSLFPWQLECLANEKVLEGKNLLYSAPTSAGKTLVAEILMIKRVLELGKKAIMILPFVSVCREKMYGLQEVFGDAGIRVEGFMGSYSPPGGFKAVDIAICTIEKANSLINRLLEEGCLSQLGTVVVDELHLIGDPHRGYLMELLLTKIKFMTDVAIAKLRLNTSNANNTAEEVKQMKIQVIGMSATLPNLELLAGWLDAELVVTDYRPVPLLERICFNGMIYDQFVQPVREVKVESLPANFLGEDHTMIYLSLETILAGHSVLIFCPTKAKCEQMAERIAKEFFDVGNMANTTTPEIGKQLRDQIGSAGIKELLSQLQQCPGGLDDVLKKAVSFGVAFHHAGLTYDERDIIEASFKRGVLRVIVATSTLSAGVNLPARRVIVSSPLTFMGNAMDVMTYRQMCGRAGRKGVDTEGMRKHQLPARSDSNTSSQFSFSFQADEGESVLLCTSTSRDIGIKLVQSSLPFVRSALLGDREAGSDLTSSMKRALLEVIASGIAIRPCDVEDYAKCTLLSKSIEAGLYDDDSNDIPSSQRQKDSVIKECLTFLEQNEFVRLQHYESTTKSPEYMPTQLGSACLASSLSPDDGIKVYKELEKARKRFVLENDLHVIYQVTPIYIADQLRVPWLNYLDIYNDLSDADKEVATLVGVEETFLMRAMIGTVSAKDRNNEKMKDKFMIHQRFYASLALNDLVNEVAIGRVSDKYTLNKGAIQNLQQAASTFAGMVTAFCGRLGWSNLELLLSQFQERLQFGIQRELCDLVRLSTMNGQRARILYDAGIKTIAELAASDPASVEHVLHRASPFFSAVHGGGEATSQQRHIWVIGKNEGLNEREAAQKIVDEARQFLQADLGLPENIDFDAVIGMRVLNSSKVDLLLGTVEEEEDDEDSDGKHSEEEEQKENRTPSPSGNTTTETVTEGLQQPNPSIQNKSTRSDDGVFEDSFPLIMEDVMDISIQKNGKGLQSIRERNGFQQASPHHIAQNILDQLIDSSMDVSECEVTNERVLLNVTPDSEVCEGNIMHSTPEVPPTGSSSAIRNNVFKRTRLSSISAITTSKHEPSPPVNQNQEAIIMNTALMLDVVEMMETSWNISEEVEDVGANKEVNRNENNPNESAKLLADMLAVANDSKFGSEDMFPSPAPQENDQNRSHTTCSDDMFSSPIPLLNTSSKSKTALSSLMTSSCLTDTLMTESEEECSSAVMSSGSYSARDPSTVSTSLFKPLMCNDKEIKVMKVLTPEALPKNLFIKDNHIAIGLKFAPPKRPASIARCGIGSRVVGPCSTMSVRHQLQEHSVALYDGGNFIWVYQWVQEEDESSPAARHKVTKLFNKFLTSQLYLNLFDAKDKLGKLMGKLELRLKLEGAGQVHTTKIVDPKVAQWILYFDEENWNVSIDKIVETHLNAEHKKVYSCGWSKEAVDAFIAWNVMDKMREELLRRQLWKPFIDMEMPSTIPLLLMEQNGFGIDSAELNRLKRALQYKGAILEIHAFHLAGKQFNLNSSKDVRQVLFKDIGLKQPPGASKGAGKDVLSKLVDFHELPKVIMEWRKVTNALSKVVLPFQQVMSLESATHNRIHGHYSHFTLTGRVNMSEPSLQCVPRDFDLLMDLSPQEMEDIREKGQIKFGSKLNSLMKQIDNATRDKDHHSTLSQHYLKSNLISMRNVFIPCSGDFTFVSADYAQLELRILAHLSADASLLAVLNKKEGDVFLSIASGWKKLPIEQVTPSMRQEAKGIVYGVIYGMGPKTLADQMQVDEKDAETFINEFMKSYPSIRLFLEETKKNCRTTGFVETLVGRRRYLPHINSKNPTERGQAERQAVNSRIQGSAADLVKTAMIKIHHRLLEVFPLSSSSGAIKVFRRSQGTSDIPKSLVYFPVLNLHDELIFEVRTSHLTQTTMEIRQQMESSLSLRVRTPVVIKSGSRWGEMQEFTFIK